jgi:uncharacterized membrane protein
MENSGNPISNSGTDPKIVGIVSYLTLIGWIVALILNNPKSEHGSFHVRQALGILLTAVISGFIAIVPILGWIVALVGYILAFVMWIMGFIGAVQGEQKVVPVLGDKFQDWFKSL